MISDTNSYSKEITISNILIKYAINAKMTIPHEESGEDKRIRSVLLEYKIAMLISCKYYITIYHIYQYTRECNLARIPTY